jgi:hypothetical protein
MLTWGKEGDERRITTVFLQIIGNEVPLRGSGSFKRAFTLEGYLKDIQTCAFGVLVGSKNAIALYESTKGFADVVPVAAFVERGVLALEQVTNKTDKILIGVICIKCALDE